LSFFDPLKKQSWKFLKTWRFWGAGEKKSSENLSDISKNFGIFFPQIFNIEKLGKGGKKFLNF